MPILIGDGVSFFDRLDKDVPLHLVEVKGYDSGMVALRYEVRRCPDNEPPQLAGRHHKAEGLA